MFVTYGQILSIYSSLVVPPPFFFFFTAPHPSLFCSGVVPIAGYAVIAILIPFKVALLGLCIFEPYNLVSLLTWLPKSSWQTILIFPFFISTTRDLDWLGRCNVIRVQPLPLGISVWVASSFPGRTCLSQAEYLVKDFSPHSSRCAHALSSYSCQSAFAERSHNQPERRK